MERGTIDMETMLQQAKALEDFIIALRHDLHQHPELGYQEFRTTERLEAEAQKLGLPYHRFDPTGLMIEIEGRPTGKRVGLRADMDALPIQETTGAPLSVPGPAGHARLRP